MDNFICCEICKREMKSITNTHLNNCHNITQAEYKKLFPNKNLISEYTKKIKSRIFLGSNNPFYEKTHSESFKQKMRNTQKGEGNNFYGKMHTKEVREKISKSNKGKKLTEESKYKISIANKGRKSKFKGISRTDEDKKKISIGTKIAMNIPETKEKFLKIVRSKEFRQKQSKSKIGEKNGMWNNGSSFEPYTLDFTNKLRNKIRNRDGRCMLCNVLLEDLKLLKKRVCIHHIDYDKTNSFQQNLITLCNSCHNLTNHGRDKWKPHFQSILKEQYNYEYTIDQKIILDFIKGEKNE